MRRGENEKGQKRHRGTLGFWGSALTARKVTPTMFKSEPSGPIDTIIPGQQLLKLCARVSCRPREGLKMGKATTRRETKKNGETG